MKYVPPSTEETAFNCPHCGALAKQFWQSAYAHPMDKDATPQIWTRERADKFDFDQFEDELRDDIRSLVERWASGAPFFEENEKHTNYHVGNLWFSRCFNCDQLSVWIYNRLVYPVVGSAPEANSDLPAEIRRDYDEASAILDLSPRGAAALIRLAIQKLCVELGQSGKNINEDIKSLVQNGLDTRVQKALDAVRVIGNNAVHPGQIDLRDDRATAETLFRLLNLVAEKMISEPKHVDEVYASLPQSQLDAIERRDKK